MTNFKCTVELRIVFGGKLRKMQDALVFRLGSFIVEISFYADDISVKFYDIVNSLTLTLTFTLTLRIVESKHT